MYDGSACLASLSTPYVLLEFIKMSIEDTVFEGHYAVHFVIVLHYGLDKSFQPCDSPEPLQQSCSTLPSPSSIDLLGEFIALYYCLYLWSDKDTLAFAADILGKKS